jgi:hemolysin activation/secretion protein
VPQEQDLLGGAFSVRGYPESIVSADEMVLASFEYAFHVPRVLRPGPPGRFLGRSFQWRPPQTRRSPDWDLVVRGFVDYAQRKVTPEREAAAPAPGVELPLGERDVDLLGAGVGVEIDVRQGLSIRADLGRVLLGLKDDDRTVVETGDLRLHLAASLAW